MSIRATFTTMAQSSPATIAEDAGRTGGYRYRGDPKWYPGRGREDSTGPGERQPANVKAMASRRERIARYCQLRDEGKTREEARAAVEVGRSAARAYEAEYQARRDGQP